MSSFGSKNVFATLGAILGWLAVLLQFILMLQNSPASNGEAVVRFFSFFTILSNTLATVCYTKAALEKAGSTSFFTAPRTISAITVYILIVGIVYNLVLRFLWAPTGLQKIVDELLHSVNPALFLLFWIQYVPKQVLRWKDAFSWLLFPLAYIVFVLVRGSFSGYYPYPFINVRKLGFERTMMNSFYLFIAFLVLSLLLVGVAKLIAGRSAVKIKNENYS
ncbi:hypothetical protein EXU57_09655 [Segetibacter sp. 3557_3]|uniref:Pr6Pr family membrane protein n=1 Tax=Segetibacter sp. 3557_3 TaxID=2547429 RepID=UPI0010590FF3|nr:Pr6Pr family membrane protein [Segetibacter sp. 3557_3]TDH27053.1 hypothetical protein EXU57_09655 [Segetibacter sp. 3557_3]